ncbi:MAG: sigma-70 family polymerase sigma factor, partial [Clostridia bacterium]|nr:sigma-70 family polymerase sigma factor [Clostridia bacterium]
RETYLWGYSQEDLMQECYLQLVKCLEKFDSSLGVPFESYYKIQLYGWRSNQNRKKREFLSMEEDLNDEITQQSDGQVDIERQIQNKLLYEALVKELGKMKSMERALVVGYYLEDKSLKELAKVLNINYKTAEFQKSKGIKRLKALLESDE